MASLTPPARKVDDMVGIVRHGATPTRATGSGAARGAVMGLIAALLVASCGTPRPTQVQTTDPVGQASPTAPSTSPLPVPTTAPSPAASPSADGVWGSLDLPPLAPVASFEATRRGTAGAAVNTAFRLTSLDGSPVALLASNLTVEPALKLIPGAPSGDEVIVRAAAPMAPGTTYRFALRRDDGSTAGAWSITAAKPLHVVGTLPGDQTADVPLDSGLEVTFDQPGVTEAVIRDHFSVEPAVAGRFEVHGRVVAFVPTKTLEPETLYTMIVRGGLPLPGTDQTLQADVIVRFETTGPASTEGWLYVPVKLADVGTADAPALTVAFRAPQREGTSEPFVNPKSLPVRVHRLAGLDAAMDAYASLSMAPDWSRSGGAPIGTGDLTETLRAEVAVHPFAEGSDSAWISLPDQVEAGWYVITITYGGADRQAIIQVTDIAAYVTVTTTRSVVWLNDIGTGAPVGGATIRLGGTSLGRTDADGLRVATTPSSARNLPADQQPIFMTVRDAAGRSMFVPVDRRGMSDSCSIWSPQAEAGDAWWHVLALDRARFHPNDIANLWGIVRARDGGALPRDLDVRLVADDNAGSGDVTIVQEHPTLNAAGVFTAKLAFQDLPPGSYRIQVRADGTVVDEAYLSVGPIVKLAYAVAVATDKRAVLTGDPVVATTTATFFEGTPVAGVDLRVGYSEEQDPGASQHDARTGSDGIATATVTLQLQERGDYEEQWAWHRLSAAPALPEEAGIQGSATVAIFRSTALLAAQGSVNGHDLDITGAVHDVAFERFAATATPIEQIDPTGVPRSGAAVVLRITEYIPTSKQVATTYDFITKRTVPVYEYGAREVDLGERTVQTDAAGAYATKLTVEGGSHSYRVLATYDDESGRRIRSVTEIGAVNPVDVQDSPRLEGPPRQDLDAPLFSIGEQVQVTFRGGHPRPANDRYLFMVSSRGLKTAVVQAGPRFTTTYRSEWVPDMEIHGVRFTGSGYEAEPAYWAQFRAADRKLTVEVTTDAARYQPGGHVRMVVRTTDTNGIPVSAWAVVRVIDEKLYAGGQAVEIDLLETMYRGISSGIMDSGWSHRPPEMASGGCGDTTGGGDDHGARSDFQDSLFFRLVRTDPDGKASVEFDLSDDLTSWRASASAVDELMRAGDGTAAIPVGLPFFVDATLADEYLTADHPILRLRGFGSALTSADQVAYEVSAPTLGLTTATTAAAAAFASAEVPLPALTLGDHRIRIKATTGSGSTRREDILIRSIHVVATRTVQARTVSSLLGPDFVVQGGATGLTTFALSDAGRGRVLPVLLSMTGDQTGRADRAIAADLARRVLMEQFAMPAGSVGNGDAGSDADLARFQAPNGGIALLPYASPDLELSALAALAGDPGLSPVMLRSFLASVSADRSTTRERGIVALAGLAALDEPVLGAIREAAAAAELTVSERAWLALAAFAGGDLTLAAELERAVLADTGERLGPWARVSTGDREADATTTALLAIVAAGLGDPLAPDLDAYLAGNPPRDTLLDLQRALAARLWVDRMPGEAAEVSISVDGAARAVTIDPGEPLWLTVTPAQLPTVQLTKVRGEVLVVSRWEAPLDPASMHPASGMTFTRAVTPVGTADSDQVVVVEFTVALGGDADHGCWRVTDMAPSGLAPLTGELRWPGDEGVSPTKEWPWRIDGQRIDFCVSVDQRRPVHQLQYLARVVTPGTYQWESAVLQSSVILDRGVVLPAFQYTIRGQR